MAVLAKGLPVFLIPEKNRITAMRNDVVDNRRRRQLSVFSAFFAERILFEKQRPCYAPLAVISSLRSILTSIPLTMFFAVHSVRQLRTARMPAWTFRLSWHQITSQYKQTAMVVLIVILPAITRVSL